MSWGYYVYWWNGFEWTNGTAVSGFTHYVETNTGPVNSGLTCWG